MTTPQPPRRLEPPAHYDDDHRAIWNDAVARLTAAGRVFRADHEVLAAYVEAVHSHRQASRLLGQTNVLITRNGQAVENPALAVQSKTATAMARASRTLGLDKTPGDPIGLPDAPDRTGGARWCDTHNRHECAKHKRRCGHDTALPPPLEGCCHQPNVTGIDACTHHSGRSRAAAREAGQVNLARLYGTPLDIDPIAGLLEEVRWSWGHVVALRALVTQIAAADGTPAGHGPAGPAGVGGDLFWGRSRTLTRDGIEVERLDTAGEHVILQAYNRERERFVKACAAAVSAGAQQQAVDTAKAVGAGLGRLLDGIFAALFVLPGDLAAVPGAARLLEWQRAQVPVVVPELIRQWNPGGDAAAAGEGGR
jgi:P27 family predicted phage terminase small subunit